MIDVEDDGATAGVPRWLVVAGGVAWRSLAIVAVIWVAARFLSYLQLLIVPLLIAIIASSLLVPASRWLEDRGLPRGLATAVSVLAPLIALSAITVFITMRISTQVSQFRQTSDQLQQRTVEWLTNGPLGLSESQVQEYIASGLQALRDSAGTILQGALAGTLIVVELVGVFLLALVLTFFFVRDRDAIVGWLSDRTPDDYREPVRRSASRSWEVLSSYVRGVLIIATADALGTAIGLVIVGVPLALTLTVLMFLGGFIPLVGATVAGFFAVVVTLVTVGPVEALVILGVIIVVQQVDSNVLQPVVMGREVSLHPVVILMAVAAGGLLWGIAGAALAVPIVAAAAAAGNELRLMQEGAAGAA